MTRESACGVSRREFLIGSGALGGAALGGCVENVQSSSESERGQVIVKGSSTVFLISDSMAEEFMADNNVNVTVDATGTGGGFKNHFCRGNSDINGASRPVTEEELGQCRENDVEPVEFQVGRDALTVAVNNDADWVDCLTYEELSQIWREDGADLWSDVRDEWDDEEIKLFGPAPTSGTYDWFNNNVVGDEYRHTPNHEQTEEDSIIIQGVEDDPYAMGYFGYAYYTENSDRVKAVEIETEDGCVAPTLDNAVDGSYPMTRPLFIYVDRDSLADDDVFDFVSFYLKQSSTELVSEVGYVPASEDLRNDNLSKLLLERP
jgi:phosphate transport system substrate-binding protein